MKIRSLADQHGIGHILVIAIVVVVAVAGIGGWLIYKKNNQPPANANTEAIREALKNAKCDLDDKDLCKFFTSWKASRYYTATMTVDTGRTTNTTVVRADGDKIHTKINAELVQETISIGNTLYTKDSERNMWYKQTTTTPSTSFFEFDESKARDDETVEQDKMNYKKLGKEKCGELTCFKYQMINPEDRQMKVYVWFDDQDYQIRKQTIETPESTIKTTFNYDKVTINEPSPYEELGEGEYYVPGQGVIDPSAMQGIQTEELQKLLEQYQQ